MGKRLTCPRCNVGNEYTVPLLEKSAPLRDVRCRACGHRFSYGFSPEYVTEADVEPQERRSPDEPYDAATETVAARERLSRHVVRYPEYHDRDRDLLLLHLLDMGDRIDNELSSIKRMLEVIVKRSPR
jgi:uncharacterized Zn finger protein (UPF0148 family)